MSIDTRAPRSTRRKPQENPDCTAERHGTYRAFTLGCTCPSGLAAGARLEEMRAKPERREKDRRTAAEYDDREAWVKKVTGGRLRIDPRVRWRGRTHTVDRFTVDAMINGYDVPSTLGEKIAAIAAVENATVSDSAFRWRKIRSGEIAKRLRLKTDRDVYRIREARARLAAQRTERRLADSVWRAAIVAAARDKRRA